jgi:membrane protein HdeD
MILSLPRLDRPVLVVFTFCLIGASLVHVIDIWQHGWLPYRFAPLSLNAYWTALTFLDALAAVLLLLRPRTGLALTLFIIASDVALNLFARFYLDLHLRAVALTLQLLFLVVLAGATLYARRTGGATQTI